MMHRSSPFRPGSETSSEGSDRSSSLRAHEILDSLPERSFDELAEIAAIICGTPFALITFLDGDRQWFKGNIGIHFQEMERTRAFCHFCVQNAGEVLQIPDTLKDERVCKHRLVTEHPFIRFYAGAPIRAKEGHFGGTVCVMDQKPGELSKDQQRTLEILASQVRKNMEMRLKKLHMERVHEQEMSRKIVESEVEERRRIGKELHDGVVQTLAAASMHVALLRKNSNSGDDEQEVDLKKLQEIIDQATQEIRGVGHSLMGKKVREKGLQSALESLASCYDPLEHTPQVMTALGIRSSTLGNVEAISLYRIAQEFIHNSIKHSNAETIWIKGGTDDENLWMTLEDDGKGLDQNELSEFGGIRNMEDRIRSLGGHCHIQSSPGEGLRLTVKLAEGENTSQRSSNTDRKGRSPSAS